VPDLPVVSVRGSAVLEVQPELASLSVSLRAEDKDRATVLKRINQRGEALDTTVERLAAAIERVETDAVRVTPVYRGDRPRERVAGYAATLVKSLYVTDFSRLGELLAQVADLELARVNGPFWSLRPDTPVYRQARIAAVRDAVAQARDYAAALGSELAELIELADTGMLGNRGPSGARHLMAASSAAPEELTFDIEPQLQTVEADIEARFRITPPDLTVQQA
jgi:hypothetical protein